MCVDVRVCVSGVVVWNR